jgi:hypothetical protein
MIGRLRTVVLDAADMDAEAQFWSALLDIPVVHRSDDWTSSKAATSASRCSWLQTTSRRTGPTPRVLSSFTSTSK